MEEKHFEKPVKLDDEKFQQLSDDLLSKVAGGSVTEYGWHPDCGGKLYMDTDSWPGEWVVWCDRCKYIVDASFMI